MTEQLLKIGAKEVGHGRYVTFQLDGAWQLLKAGEDTVWDVDWTGLSVPVLNICSLSFRR